MWHSSRKKDFFLGGGGPQFSPYFLEVLNEKQKEWWFINNMTLSNSKEYANNNKNSLDHIADRWQSAILYKNIIA